MCVQAPLCYFQPSHQHYKNDVINSKKEIKGRKKEKENEKKFKHKQVKKFASCHPACN
jgi:hypothetical protein